MEGQGGFVFEHKENGGPNGWMVIMYSGLFGLALFIVALALFALASSVGVALVSLAQYGGWAMLIVSGGQFVVFTCRGTAMIIEARGRARALEKEAEGRYVAAVRAARLSQPSSPWREVNRWENGHRN